jgi:hypothetical protein
LKDAKPTGSRAGWITWDDKGSTLASVDSLIERSFEIVKRMRIEITAEQGGELKADKGLAGAPAVKDHVQVRLGSDQDSAGLAVDRENVSHLIVFKLSENTR